MATSFQMMFGQESNFGKSAFMAIEKFVLQQAGRFSIDKKNSAGIGESTG